MTVPDPQRIIDRLVARGLARPVRQVETDAARTVAAQDAIETGTQIVGDDDEYA